MLLVAPGEISTTVQTSVFRVNMQVIWPFLIGIYPFVLWATARFTSRYIALYIPQLPAQTIMSLIAIQSLRCNFYASTIIADFPAIGALVEQQSVKFTDSGVCVRARANRIQRAPHQVVGGTPCARTTAIPPFSAILAQR